MSKISEVMMFKLQELEGSTKILENVYINLLEGRMKEDYVKRNYNIKNGKELCDICSGTGTMIFEDSVECTHSGCLGYVE